jgi:hypothetical protein
MAYKRQAHGQYNKQEAGCYITNECHTHTHTHTIFNTAKGKPMRPTYTRCGSHCLPPLTGERGATYHGVPRAYKTRETRTLSTFVLTNNTLDTT